MAPFDSYAHFTPLDRLKTDVIAKNDVTVLSDNHFTSAHKYRDLFSDKNLRGFAKAGLTDIYIEIPQELDSLKDDLKDWKISKKQFLDKIDDMNLSVTGSDKARPIMNNAANMVLNAQFHGINVHFSQTSFSPEQTKDLLETAKQKKELRESYYDPKVQTIDQFLIDSGIGDQKREDFIGMLYAADTDPQSNIFKPEKLDQFREELTPYKMSELSLQISELKIYQTQSTTLHQTLSDKLIEYRIGSDHQLADIVAQNDGKSLIVHGALHGGSSKNDLDDLIAAQGKTVGRVNLSYDDKDRLLLSGQGEYKQLQDPSEMFFNPKRDQLEEIDLNGNGVIEAGPSIRKPAAQTPAP